jgi:hypothetical protein
VLRNFMNTRAPRAVLSPTVGNIGLLALALGTLLLFLLLGGALAACVPVNGGAVELSWTVLDAQGGCGPAGSGSVSFCCSQQGISTVELCVQDCDTQDASTGSCTGKPTCPSFTFSCDRTRGATDFAISPGRKKLWITVTCTNGATPSGISVPEPLLRDVTSGDVTELNALLISVPSDRAACSAAAAAKETVPTWLDGLELRRPPT